MRGRLLALAGLLALPTLAAAQVRDPGRPVGQLPDARFAITPFVALRVPYATGDQYVFTDAGPAYLVSEERGGGAVAGAEVEMRARGPLSVLGSLAYGSNGEHQIVVTSEEGEVIPLRADGPETFMAKLALAYRLPEPRPDNRRFRPAGFLSVGPSLVRMDYDADDEFGGSWTEPINHWGLNFGIHTATTLGSPRVALHFGLEDFLTFWDTERLSERDAVIFGSVLGDESARVDFNYSASNIILLRAGISLRF